MCKAVSPQLSLILTSIPPFINNSTVLSCLSLVAKIDIFLFIFNIRILFYTNPSVMLYHPTYL